MKQHTTTAFFPNAARLVLATGLSLLATGSALGQDSTLARIIHKYQYPLVANGTQFSGTGWDKIRQDVAQSQFLLLGEAHGSVQVPQFAAALAQVLQPKLFVAEIDPYEAQDLTHLVAQPGPPTAFFKQHPMALSFYSWPSEFALVRQLRAQNVTVLGIDQVNFFSTGRFYSQLAEQAKTKAAKTYLTGRAVAYQAHDRAAMRADLTKATMFQQPAAALDSLLALTRPESAQVQKAVRDYAASARIYQATMQAATGRQAHQDRVNLMKHNLLQALRPYQPTAADPLPKMLFKFGGNHMTRNLSFSGVFDLGNLMVNLADAQSQKTLHILVLGKQGTVTSGFNPDDVSKNSESYKPEADDPNKLFYEQATPAAWSVVDLRPARRALLAHKLSIANKDLETTVLGFDYVVIVSETTANPAF